MRFNLFTDCSPTVLSRARDSANGRAHIRYDNIDVSAFDSPDFADCPARHKADNDSMIVREKTKRYALTDIFIFRDTESVRRAVR